MYVNFMKDESESKTKHAMSSGLLKLLMHIQIQTTAYIVAYLPVTVNLKIKTTQEASKCKRGITRKHNMVVT